MNHIKFIDTLISKLWLIIMLTIITTSASFYLSYLQFTPEYESVSTMFVASEKPELQSAITNKDMARDYCELLQDNKVMLEVITRLKLNITPEMLAKQVIAKQKNGTNVIEIKVRSSTTHSTLEIAEELNDVAINMIKELTGDQTIFIISKPTVSSQPVSTSLVKKAALTFMATAAGILMLLFAIALIDTTIRGKDDIPESMELNVLSVIPNHTRQFEFYDYQNEKILEYYNAIRLNIYMAAMEKGIKTIAITSANPKEGRTSVSINLAMSMAGKGLRALWVNADLRKPAKTKRFNRDLSLVRGLVDYLLRTAGFNDIVNNTHIRNFYYISCGQSTSAPGDLLSKVEFVRFIDEAEKAFDIVVLDTPPILNYFDAIEIAANTGASILIARNGRTNQKSIIQAKQQLENVKAYVMGIILKKMDCSIFSLIGRYFKFGRNNKCDKLQ